MNLMFGFFDDKQTRILKLRDLIKGKRLRCIRYQLSSYGELSNDEVVDESWIRDFINYDLCIYENFSYYVCKNGNVQIRLIVRDLESFVFYRLTIYSKGGDKE